MDVRGLILSRWDYMGGVADGGMTPRFREHFASHPFPRFTDPAGMGAPAQAVHGPPPQQQQQPRSQVQRPQVQTQEAPPRGRTLQVPIPPRVMGSDTGAGSSGAQPRRSRRRAAEEAPEEERPAAAAAAVQEEEMAEAAPEGPVPGDTTGQTQAQEALRRARDRVRGLQRTIADLTIQVATRDERLRARDEEIRTLRQQLAIATVESSHQSARAAYYFAAYSSVVPSAAEQVPRFSEYARASSGAQPPAPGPVPPPPAPPGDEGEGHS